MVARFRQMTQRPALDRQEMMRRALQSAQSRRQAAAPTRGGSPLADRVGGLHGAEGAVEFGRAMTGQNTGLQQAMEAIRSRVGQGLASKGIYQDQSGYHIQGLPQAPDTGIAMRDAAVQAMGGDPWTKIVQEADARLRAGNLPIPRTAGVNGPVPSPGLGGVPSQSGMRPVATNTVTPPTVSGGRTGTGIVPQPGLGGVPPVRPPAPAPAGGTVPQPGLGGVPQVPVRPSNVTPFPPQGQGVGRTTTPTGNQVDPGRYPITTPQTAINANDRIGISAPTQQSIDNGAFQPYASPTLSAVGNQVIDPNASQQGRIGSGTGGQVIGAGTSQPPRPNSATVTTPGRVNPQTGVPSPGLGGVPQAPGRPATPTVAPGALPGQSTPSRPGQMPTTFPNGRVFGSQGQTTPAQPLGDLSGLGDQIEQSVQSRIAGIRGQTPLAGQQETGMASLAGLGDRIRASVQRATSGTSATPGVGASDLGGGLGASIMGRVQAQLQQAGVGQVGTLGQPGTGNVTTPGGPAPGAPTTAAPAPPSAMPTGTGSLGQMGGRYESLDQYNAVFEAAGKEFGVPPELLKAMAGIESGWGSVGPDYCRSDGSCGIMQVKGDIWNGTAGCSNQNDVVCNVRTAAAILSQAQAQCGNWDCAITGTYFPTDDVQNGTTQGQYLDAVHQSMQEQAGNPGTGQAVAPAGAPQQIDPATGAPIGATPVTGAAGGTAATPVPGGPPVPAGPDPRTGVVAPPGSLTLPPQGIIQMPDASAQQIVDIAQLYVGVVPYESLDVWNGNPGAGIDPRDPAQHGWDCSGMVYWLDQNYGSGNIPEGSHEQYNYFDQTDPNFHARDAAVTAGDYSSLKVGDLVYMDSGASVRAGNNASHVAIYIGNGQFVNAANPTDGTTIWNGLNGYQVLGVATAW